jgi:voltage-gated potassium channel
VNTDQRARAFEAFDKAVDLPMLLITLLLLPVIAIPLLFQVSGPVEQVFQALDWMIWAAFAFELGIKTYLAPRRIHYLVTHWYDVLIVVIPFFRPLRIVRSARLLSLLGLLRFASIIARAETSVRYVLGGHGFHYILLSSFILLIAAAVLVTILERDAGGSIDSFENALWWTAATVTTVGYGDTTPVTAAGRGVGVLVMLVGISLFSLLTANVSAFFVAAQRNEVETATLEEVMSQLLRIEEQLGQLRQAVENRT